MRSDVDPTLTVDELGATVGGGATVATCAHWLVPPKTVTVALSAPTLVGGDEKVTTRDVDVEAVTAPTAPLVNETRLFEGCIGSKPLPAIVRVVALTASFVVFGLIVGVATMSATSWGVPLEIPKEVTTAVSGPRVEGCGESTTFREVGEDAVMLPAAPLLRTSELLPGEGLKPKPEMRSGAAEFIPR